MNTDYMDYTDTLLRPPLVPPDQGEKQPFWEAWMSTESVFCKAVVKCGYLTEEQMLRAAERYRLGRSRDGGVIFWQIDEEGRTRDGKIMYYREDCHRDKSHHPSWASARLKAYYGYDGDLPVDRCLFGLHLLTSPERQLPLLSRRGKGWSDPPQNSPAQTLSISPYSGGEAAAQVEQGPKSVISVISVCQKKTVCVVEAEKTAVILSELYPQYVWLAAGGLGEVQVEKFRPLRGHKVILFPDTDPDGIAFKRWSEAAAIVMNQVFWEDSPPIRVSPVLELHSTPSQKAAKIDLIDFLA